jgi:hypothetical protein
MPKEMIEELKELASCSWILDPSNLKQISSFVARPVACDPGRKEFTISVVEEKGLIVIHVIYLT